MTELNVINIDKSDRQIIKELKESGFLSLEDSSNIEIFLLAFSIGYRDKTQIPLESKESYVRYEYLSEADKAIIFSCAIEHFQTTDVLNDKSKIMDYVQEAAHYGFMVLDNYKSHGSFEEIQRNIIEELYNKYDLLSSKFQE